MKSLSKVLFILLLIICMSACQSADIQADLIIFNAKIQTVDANNLVVQALAVKDGRILDTGTNEEMTQYNASQKLDAHGKFVMPGFIEGHAHFSGLGYSLINLNLMKTTSWNEIVALVEEKVKTAKPGEWIEGRGWHQEKWTESPGETTNGYPYHKKLSDVSPNNPVILTHASGHGLFANGKAMEIAGVSLETPDPSGGRIVRDDTGEAIGVFEERAMSTIRASHRAYLDGLSQDELTAKWYSAITKAQEDCLRKGVTSFQDAGSSYTECKRYEGLAKDEKLDMRLWVMIRQTAENLEGKVSDYRKINVGDHFYTCRALKTSVDGALGSYGAWLLKSYDDKSDFVGQNTTEIDEIQKISEIAAANEMQYCVHAIGDRANREVLDIFSKHVNPSKNMRWRIEHAQHIHPDDIPRFAELGVIPAMQGIHCTSDAPFVVKRLGQQRAREGAYAWRSLMDAGSIIANGTDAPVEDVDPIPSFYASVTRKRADNKMIFFPMQKMNRIEAIRSYTINNAYAAFEEEYKGSLEVGKVADIVILSEDLMSCSDDEILDTEILYTIVDGKVKYQKSI